MNSHTFVPCQTTHSMTHPSSQIVSIPTENQIRTGGIFLLLLVIGCVCLRRWYQHQQEQQLAEQYRQHIESLERIWRREAYQKSEGDSR